MSFPTYLLRSKSTRWQIILTAVLAAAFIAFIVRSFLLSHGWGEVWIWMEPFLAIGAVVVAVFIWLNEKRENWESTLPKRLDVCFCLPGEESDPIYEVINAPLAGIADIRQWGQQIGKQMNNNEYLAFNGFRVDGPISGTDKKHGFVMRYRLTVWLQSRDASKSKKVWKYDDDGKLCYAGQHNRTKAQEELAISLNP